MNMLDINNINAIEKLLDAGKLEVAMRNGNHWKIRRNGKTIIQPRKGAFRIPVKAGFRTTFQINSTDLESQGIREVVE